MIKEKIYITHEQADEIYGLVKEYCCNFYKNHTCYGGCYAPDRDKYWKSDTEELRCNICIQNPQSNCIACKYFFQSVLPNDKELGRRIIKNDENS